MASPRIVQVSDTVTLYNGDAREIVPTLKGVGACVSDVPYGINFERGAGGKGISKAKKRNDYKIAGDDKPFDPAHLLHLPCILFGANHFYARLPDGGTFHVWDKSRGVGPKDDFSDAEFAWTSWRRNSDVIRYLWKGLLQDGEKGLPKFHIMQKPIAVMQWAIEMVREPGPILDPYMGSGSTGVAAVRMGRPFIGIEIDPGHFETALKRITEAVAGSNDLFIAPASGTAGTPLALFGDDLATSTGPQANRSKRKPR